MSDDELEEPEDPGHRRRGFPGLQSLPCAAERGARVTALDGFLFGGGANPRRQPRRRRVELVRGDIREIDLRPLCEGAEVIFNLAAQPAISADRRTRWRTSRSMRWRRSADPGGARGCSRRGCRACLDAPVLRPRDGLPVDETIPLQPPDANGVSKFAGEQYWMMDTGGRRPVVSLRLTNCYGPRFASATHGRPFSASGSATCWRKPFEVWGGEQLRDLTYVDDVTEGVPVRRGDARVPWQNLQYRWSAAGVLEQIAETDVRVPGGDARFVMREFPADRARIDIGSYHADDTAFRAATGWTPRVGLEEGIRRSLDWYPPAARRRICERRAMNAFPSPSTGQSRRGLSVAASRRSTKPSARARLRRGTCSARRAEAIRGGVRRLGSARLGPWAAATAPMRWRLRCGRWDRAGIAVVTVSHTAVATVAAIEMAGAAPVLSTSIRSTTRWTRRNWPTCSTHPPRELPPIRAVIPVHLYGQAGRSRADHGGVRAARRRGDRGLQPGAWRDAWRAEARHA